MSTRTRNVTENNEALRRPPIIGISTTEPATDRRLNWPNDLSILLEDLRTSYSVTERVIGRAGYLFRQVYDSRTENSEELAQLQSEWREQTPIHALNLILFRNDIKSAFVACRDVVPVNADIFVDLAERMNSLCVVATEEKLEQIWASLFALGREIAALAQAVSLRQRCSENKRSMPRAPAEWRMLLEKNKIPCSETQWKIYRKGKYKVDIQGPSKDATISRRLAEIWELNLPEFR